MLSTTCRRGRPPANLDLQEQVLKIDVSADELPVNSRPCAWRRRQIVSFKFGPLQLKLRQYRDLNGRRLTPPQLDQLVARGKTFAYDLATGMWHERSTRDALKNIFHKWAVTHCAFAYGRILCGNGEVPKLLELSLDKYDEWDGRPIVKLHQSPVYFTDGRILYHDRFYLDVETGVGLQLGQGSNPEVMMQYSDDGGHTWSSERWTTLGKIGKYKTRVVWRNNGRTRQRVYRVLVSDPVKVIMIGAGLDYSVGLNR